MQAVSYYAQPYRFGPLTQGWTEPPIGAEYTNGCAPSCLPYRKMSIYSGSNEAQHNNIAKGRARPLMAAPLHCFFKVNAP